jgi:hypothetical protein
MATHSTTRQLLAEYAELLNEYGVDSVEASSFLEANKSDAEFYELAQISSRLKRALTAPKVNEFSSH